MKKILLILFFSLLFFPQLTLADGAYFPPDGYYMYETGQKAAIFYEGNTETMALSTSFEGDAKNFTWIVPTPSKPEVTKLSKDLFTNLEALTQTDYYDNQNIMPMSLGTAEVATKDVTVVEQKQLGYYDITVLESTNAEALYKYLSDNGFKFPEEGKYILDEYIKLGWDFTAIKITESALSDSGLTSKLNSGDISPLKFVFSTDKIVYPMKISGIARFDKTIQKYLSTTNATSSETVSAPANGSDTAVSSDIVPPYYDGSTHIDLYIFTDHKQEISGFTTTYANWVKALEIEKLGHDDAGNSWVDASKKYYLTKFSDYKQFTDMEDDLFPSDAANNTKVGVDPWYVVFWNFIKDYFVLILIILALCFYIPIICQLRSRDPKLRKGLWILQLVSMILLNIPILLLLFAFFASNTPYYWSSFYYIQLWFGVMLLMLFPILNMIILLVLQKKLQK